MYTPKDCTDHSIAMCLCHFIRTFSYYGVLHIACVRMQAFLLTLLEGFFFSSKPKGKNPDQEPHSNMTTRRISPRPPSSPANTNQAQNRGKNVGGIPSRGGGVISTTGELSPPKDRKFILKSIRVEMVEMVEVFSVLLLSMQTRFCNRPSIQVLWEQYY
jgi:hypothetical protein